MPSATQPVVRVLARYWNAYQQTPFGCLLRVFIGRIFHGGGEPGAEEGLDLGIGVILILLAMPGVLASLLMFEEYGSLIRFLRGDGVFDPYVATIPDEYFFIVLSMTVTGAAGLWRWDAIFLDRRDYANLVPLPIHLHTIFLVNFSGIVALAALFTFVVNAASMVLFPVAVVGSQPSFGVFFRFAAGHAAAVFLASIFSFAAIFALAGVLMALLPATVFRRISLLARFVIAICLLALLASNFAVRSFLDQTSLATKHRVAMLPPVWFVGISQTVWGNGSDPFYSSMTTEAFAALAYAALIAIFAYTVSFRRSFIRIPETADAGPVPQGQLKFLPVKILHKTILRTPSQSACYDFIVRTLLRSDGHLQIVLAFGGLGLVSAATSLSSLKSPHLILAGPRPSVEFLSVPFILSYCIIVGTRFAFEIPTDLRANWIFRLWLSPDNRQARPIARWVLHAATLPWLMPAVFVVTLIFFGWTNALLHTAILTLSSVLVIEILLVKYRKIPFTCSYPKFESHSGVVLLTYLFGFFIIANYIPELEHWSQSIPSAPFVLFLFLESSWPVCTPIENKCLKWTSNSSSKSHRLRDFNQFAPLPIEVRLSKKLVCCQCLLMEGNEVALVGSCLLIAMHTLLIAFENLCGEVE